MSMKRVVSAAAIATGLSISALLNPGFANAAPMDPPPPCPNCHGGGGGGGGNPGGAPQAPQNPPQTQQSQPQTHEPPSTQSEPPPTHPASHRPCTSQPPAVTAEPPATHSASRRLAEHQPQARRKVRSRRVPRQRAAEVGDDAAGCTHHGAECATHYWAGPNDQHHPPSKPGVTVVLNPPSTQPPHPAYIPRRDDLVAANAQIGGPRRECVHHLRGSGTRCAASSAAAWMGLE